MSICTDTNQPDPWNPFRVLAFGGIGLVLLATAVLALIGACTGGSPPQPSTGTISLAWSIFDATTQPATCDQVSARSVALRLRPRAGGTTIAAAMPCAPGSGTAQVAAGVYDIAIELHAADGTRLATAQDQTGITITAGQTTPLTATRFAANMTFRLVASIVTPLQTNCQSKTHGGAGITGATVTLERVDPGREGCAAVTFSRAQGDTQGGTYTVNCSSPAETTCIENNETLTASVPPGTYLIHVRGQRGAFDCWRGNDKLTVSASSLATLHTVPLLHQDEPPC